MKAAGASRGSGAAPDEIDQAARETETSAPTQSEARSFDTVAVDRYSVSPEIAMSVVKGFFSPLAKYDHPAWELTDEEAGPVVPKMQKAIQALLDRHMPEFAMKLMAKYPELLGVTYAMALLYYAKFKAVRLVRMEEYRAEQRRVAEAQRAEAARVATAKPADLIYQPEGPETGSGSDSFLPREEPPPKI